MKCIVDAWEKHETELRRYLRHRSDFRFPPPSRGCSARARLKARMSEACQVSYDAAGQVEGFVPRPPAS